MNALHLLSRVYSAPNETHVSIVKDFLTADVRLNVTSPGHVECWHQMKWFKRDNQPKHDLYSEGYHSVIQIIGRPEDFDLPPRYEDVNRMVHKESK